MARTKCAYYGETFRACGKTSDPADWPAGLREQESRDREEFYSERIRICAHAAGKNRSGCSA